MPKVITAPSFGKKKLKTTIRLALEILDYDIKLRKTPNEKKMPQEENIEIFYISHKNIFIPWKTAFLRCLTVEKIWKTSQ